MKKTALFVSFLLILSACQSLKRAPIPTDTPAPTATATQVPTATLEPTPGVDEIRRVIVNALFSLNTKSNHMDVTTVLEDGQTVKEIIEFVPPDKKRIVVEGEETEETIVAGGKVYLKPSETAPWEETQATPEMYLGGDFSEEAISSTLGEVAYVRSDLLDGHSIKIYQYSSTMLASGIELHSQTELWVGQADGLPYKMVVNGETLMVVYDPKTGESKPQAVKTQSTMLIVFDPALKIGPPLP
jgi:hypothetical protein